MKWISPLTSVSMRFNCDFIYSFRNVYTYIYTFLIPSLSPIPVGSSHTQPILSLRFSFFMWFSPPFTDCRVLIIARAFFLRLLLASIFFYYSLFFSGCLISFYFSCCHAFFLSFSLFFTSISSLMKLLLLFHARQNVMHWKLLNKSISRLYLFVLNLFLLFPLLWLTAFLSMAVEILNWVLHMCHDQNCW